MGRVKFEDTSTRRIGDLDVEQTVIHWHDTELISVDYHAAGVDLWADPDVCTSHDDVLSDDQLRDLLAQYGVSTHPV